MALNLKLKYASQIETADPAYPYGKARNDQSEDDGTGTPLEKEWLNDIFGWEQALLSEAGITPSGDPDEVGASQYLEALETVVALVVEAGDFEVEGYWEFAFAAEFLAGSTATFGGTVVLGGTDQTLQTPLVCNSTGRVVKRRVAVPNENKAYTIQDGDLFVLADSTQTETRTHTLGTTGASAGDEVEFVTFDTGYSVVFNGVSHTVGTGQRYASRWSYNGASWDKIDDRYAP